MKILRVHFKEYNKIGEFNEPTWLPDKTGKCRGVEAHYHTQGIVLYDSDEMLLIPWADVKKVYFAAERSFFHESATTAASRKP